MLVKSGLEGRLAHEVLLVLDWQVVAKAFQRGTEDRLVHRLLPRLHVALDILHSGLTVRMSVSA